MASIARQTGFVDNEGERIYFETAGGGGVPLVLSHGAGGNHAVWYQQVAAFAGDRLVVTWDHRGYGRSSDRADRSGPEVATGDLLAVLDHLGIDRADLVGQSMGGWTAVGAVLTRPRLARSLVLADTLAGFTSAAIMATMTRPQPVRLQADDRLGYHPALGRRFSETEPERAHLYQMLGRMGSADPAVVLPRLLACTHDASEAARVAVPVLCVVGSDDDLFPPDSVRAMASLLLDAQVVEIPGCGHSPYFEDAPAWNEAVRHFLAGRDGP